MYDDGKQHRKQHVKTDLVKGKWMGAVKGSPQTTLIGAFTYNAHSNDLLFLIFGLCHVYNYADDNTVHCVSNTVKKVTEKCRACIKWSELNTMKTYPDEVQFIINNNDVNVINVNNVEIQAQHVTLLWVNTVVKLTFSDHVSELYAKAGCKLSVLASLSNVLNYVAKMII